MPAENSTARLRELRARYQEGANTLATPDLLALVLGTHRGPRAFELAERLLKEHGGLLGIARLRLAELLEVEGIGIAKSVQLRAMFELANRLTGEAARERPVIRSPADVANLLMPDMAALEQEQLRVVMLDVRNRVQGVHTVYQGGAFTVTIRTAEVFREPVRCGSAGVIVVHNHPSGDPSPSPEDVAITRTLIETGKLLDIELLDHIILGQGRFVSLKERGLGF